MQIAIIVGIFACVVLAVLISACCGSSHPSLAEPSRLPRSVPQPVLLPGASCPAVMALTIAVLLMRVPRVPLVARMCRLRAVLRRCAQR